MSSKRQAGVECLPQVKIVCKRKRMYFQDFAQDLSLWLSDDEQSDFQDLEVTTATFENLKG